MKIHIKQLSLLLSVLLLSCGNNPSTKTNSEVAKEPQVTAEFRIDDKLDFIDGESGEVISSISIEIANNPHTRERGLMYRDYMPDSVGMLFIFEREEYRSFWMRNTSISLDIIYADSKGKIVSILKNTQPFSLGSLPSEKPALYVVEVNAGYTNKKGIKKGDYIKKEGW